MTPPSAPPPRLARWLAAALAPETHRDEILGDLDEIWNDRKTFIGWRARWTYWRHALSLVWWARRASSRTPRATPPVRGGAGWTVQAGQDVRYAARTARRQPASTALTVGTLALGIASATAIFTICDRVLMQPLPYTDPDRIVVLDNVPFSFSARGMGVPPSIAAVGELSAVGLYAPGGLNVGDADTPRRVGATAVTHGFFPALGAAAIVGRTTDANHDRDAARVAVLSFETWRRVFGEDRGALGREIRLNSQAFTVVGVMPRGFAFPAGTDLWIPVGSDQQITGAALAPMMVARLRPGVSQAQAADALARADAAGPGGPPEDRPIVTSLQEELVGPTRPSLLFLAVLASLLLAATSANVAGLALARLRVRERELLLRAALGASAGRLLRQVATEAALSAVAGAAVGCGLAVLILRIFRGAVPTFAPHVDLVTLDADMFAIAGAVTLFASLVFSLGPAAAVLRRQAATALRDGAAGSRRIRWFGHTLVVVQIAAALVLLAGTTAALAALVRLSQVDLGFTNRRAVVFELTLPFSRYGDTERVGRLIDDLERGLRVVPGVATVGVSDYAPGSTQTGIGLSLLEVHEPKAATEGRPTASLVMASPDYFRAMGIRVIAGRAFTASDTAGAPRVAIIGETAARALASDPAGAIGKRLQSRIGAPVPGGIEVVGVVGDVRLRQRMTGTQTQFYLPVGQSFARGSAAVVLDVDGAEAPILARAREVLRAIDPELPLYNVVRIADLRARFLATERLTLAVGGAFGGIALGLAALGLYGILSHLVTDRRREIGIRMALGADRARLTRGVVFTSLRYAALGSGIGAAVAFGSARLFAAVVPTVDLLNAPLLAGDALVLVIVAALAAWAPARRAARVDPLIALRD